MNQKNSQDQLHLIQVKKFIFIFINYLFIYLGCEIEEKCSDDAIPYKIISGDGIEKYPIICFNNKLYVFN